MPWPGRRKAIRDAGENATGELVVLPSELPDKYQLLQEILPGASDKNARNHFDIEQGRALSAILLSSSNLDSAKVLSPLLADPRLRKVWSTGNVVAFRMNNEQLTDSKISHRCFMATF